MIKYKKNDTGDTSSPEFIKLEKGYKSALKDKKESVKTDARIALGTLYYETHRYEESEVNLKKALDYIQKSKSNGKLSLVYRSIGLVYLRLFRLKDSEAYLLKALDKTPETNKRMRSLTFDALGDVYTRMSVNETGLEYYKKALDIRKELLFWNGVSETLNKIGVNYYFQGKYREALKYVGESLDLRQKRKEKKENAAACYNNLCLAHFQLGEYDTALKYGLTSLKLYEEAGVKDTQGMVFNNLGLVYFEMSLFSEALDCQFKALKIKEESGNQPVIANTLNNIGVVFTRLYNLEKALEYSNRALEIRKSVNDMRGVASSYNDIGRIYDKMNDFDKATEYFLNSISIRRELNTLFGLAVSLENLGMVYFKQGRYDEAEKHLFEAKRINEELGEKKAISGVNRNISNLFLIRGKYSEAIVYIKRSYDIAVELGLKDKLRDAYKIFSEIYAKKNNYKRSLTYYAKYSATNEEMLNLRKQHEINRVTVEYENYKNIKEAEIYRLKNIELAKVNRELKNSRSELMKSNFSKDKFFNIIAHDLKNPFSILYTTSELLYEYFDDLSLIKQKEYIKTINLSTKHLLKLVENLLEWSRSQRGSKQFNPQKFNFTDSLNSCIELLKPSADSKNIEISSDADTDMYILADKNMIKTVMRNLITNAVKFTRKGGSVRISAKKAEGMLRFSITDDGIGIRKKDVPKLFVIDKHFATNGTENEKGTGLGLLICKEFIEKHNGKMLVESVFKKGSTFGFEIPEV